MRYSCPTSASNLTVDGTQVTGTVDLILDYDGATQCPETEQEVGIPQSLEVTGHIEGDTFYGELSPNDLVVL
ncbi:MAG TPA: hypothetical protein QGF35_02935 [Dehalococcoidia bacterium]|jgi:hypothetical protein|nr:hypothetical protein [Dehalococcoidia bacterium]